MAEVQPPAARARGRVSPNGYFRIRREAGGFLFDSRFAHDQRVTDVGDDWLLVEATVPSTRELRRWLFGFAPYIEVIDPPQMREELQDAARRLLERHGNTSLATPGSARPL